MKRYIRSTDAMNPGWSKRYNRDKGYHFYVLSIPNRTATVNCIDDNTCDANVHGRDIDAQDMTFEGEDCIDDAMTWCEEQIYKKAVKSSTDAVRSWTEYLPEDVYNRLANCRSIKSDIKSLVDAKWRRMRELGKERKGFTREDALVAVLELLDSNGTDYELTRDEYDDLKKDLNKTSVKSSKAITSSIDGWDNRTGVIKRIDKYLYKNPDAVPPKGYVDPHGRSYESLKARYGDYVTTPFINIETEDLMTYAEENGLL